MNGCVSYNYYEKDYFPLKQGGTKSLDMITNGLETPVMGSGRASGALLGALLSGTQPSWSELLRKTSATDTLRVVDGEVDNAYTPTKSPIAITDTH